MDNVVFWNFWKSILAVSLLLLVTPAHAQQEATLRIQVIAPPNTPPNDSIIIVGDQPEFGNWFYPRGKTMKNDGNGLYSYEGRFNRGSQLNFKICRGSWFKEALYNGATPPTSIKLTTDTLITLKPSTWNDLFHRSITGDVRYHHQFADERLKKTRDVTVWLPPSYHISANKRYPVLYVHDGQNVFDASTAYTGEWHLDETADSLMRKGLIEEFIMVAIDNTSDRMVEYSGAPEGINYVNFIAHNLKPFIDSHYRTLTDAPNTAAIGSSMGGLISFYMLWLCPEVFGKAACLSSGFAFDEGNIMKEIKTGTDRMDGKTLYMDIGGKGLDHDFEPANAIARDQLVKNKNMLFLYKEFLQDDHNERAWAQRLPIPLLFLFGKPTHP